MIARFIASPPLLLGGTATFSGWHFGAAVDLA
jgi:hypothetical protein